MVPSHFIGTYTRCSRDETLRQRALIPPFHYFPIAVSTETSLVFLRLPYHLNCGGPTLKSDGEDLQATHATANAAEIQPSHWAFVSKNRIEVNVFGRRG